MAGTARIDGISETVTRLVDLQRLQLRRQVRAYRVFVRYRDQRVREPRRMIERDRKEEEEEEEEEEKEKKERKKRDRERRQEEPRDSPIRRIRRTPNDTE